MLHLIKPQLVIPLLLETIYLMLVNMVMDSGWNLWLATQLNYLMANLHPGTLFLDLLKTTPIKMLIWVIEFSLFSKAKEFTNSRRMTKTQEIQMSTNNLNSWTLKVNGLMFTSVTHTRWEGQWHSLLLTLLKDKCLMLLIASQLYWDLFLEEMM
jgi:hypothetical protein